MDVGDLHWATTSDNRSPTGTTRSTQLTTAPSGRLSPIERRGLGFFVEDGPRQDHLVGFPLSSDYPDIAVGSQGFPNTTSRPTLVLETAMSRDGQPSNSTSSCSPRSDAPDDPFEPLTPRAVYPSSSRASTAYPLSRARLPPIRTTSPLSDRGPQVPHHYPGRPLPRPPGPESPLYMSYGLRHDPVMPLAQQNGHVPEGLLIDFESDCLESAVQPQSQQGDHSVDRGTSETPLRSPPPVQLPLPTTPTPTPTSERPLPPAFSQYTDLDLILSRLEDEDRTGANYEVSDPTFTLYHFSHNL
jgi:hypothetical protein